MDGITLYQSVLTAIGSFVPEMGGFTETVGVTAYQSVLTAVGSFPFLRWMASVVSYVGKTIIRVFERLHFYCLLLQI